MASVSCRIASVASGAKPIVSFVRLVYAMSDPAFSERGHSPPSSRSSLLRRLSWPAAVVAIALLAASEAFSNSRVYYLRDLAGYFWPHHLWLRRTIWSGSLPLWAPEAGLGYATIADPNLQLLFPLSIAGRVLLPDALGWRRTGCSAPSTWLPDITT